MELLSQNRIYRTITVLRKVDYKQTINLRTFGPQ